uniref:Uncharacterized protein n=1 Tax=Solanum lycopersicum TaxID=4081 RepID=A0A3Q7GHD8_SOLLC
MPLNLRSCWGCSDLPSIGLQLLLEAYAQGCPIFCCNLSHLPTDERLSLAPDRCYVADVPATWVSMLPWAEFRYNTSYQTSAGMTPFQALYGYEPPTVARYILGSTSSELVESSLLKRDKVLQLLKHNSANAQNRMKAFADKSRTEITYDVGDW